jgi:hypothetical protein
VWPAAELLEACDPESPKSEPKRDNATYDNSDESTLPDDVRDLIVNGAPQGVRSEKFDYVVKSL